MPPNKPALRGNLGALSLAFTVIAFNGPIANIAGFIPIVVLRGNGFGAPLTFLLLSVVVLVFAVGLNAMASRMTQPGAFYTYITEGLGRPVGLVAGFLAIASYEFVGAGSYALFASVVMHLLKTTLHISNSWPWWSWAALGWAVSTLLSFLNIDLSAKVLGTLSAAELVIALAWNIAVLSKGGPDGWAVPVMDHFFSGSLALALVFGVLSLTGFESLQVFRSETKSSSRSVPIATYISVAFLSLLYLSSSYCYIISIGTKHVLESPMDDLTGSTLASFGRYLGGTAGLTASTLLATSVFAACLANQNIVARYLFMFGQEGILPRRLGVASERHGSPMFAAAMSGAIYIALFGAAAALGIGVNDTLTDYLGIGSYCLILLWVMTSIAIFVFFIKRRHEERISILSTIIAPAASAIALCIVFWMTTQHFSELLGGNKLLARVVLFLLAGLIVAGLLIGARRPHESDPQQRLAQRKTPNN